MSEVRFLGFRVLEKTDYPNLVPAFILKDNKYYIVYRKNGLYERELVEIEDFIIPENQDEKDVIDGFKLVDDYDREHNGLDNYNLQEDLLFAFDETLVVKFNEKDQRFFFFNLFNDSLFFKCATMGKPFHRVLLARLADDLVLIQEIFKIIQYMKDNNFHESLIKDYEKQLTELRNKVYQIESNK